MNWLQEEKRLIPFSVDKNNNDRKCAFTTKYKIVVYINLI